MPASRLLRSDIDLGRLVESGRCRPCAVPLSEVFGAALLNSARSRSSVRACSSANGQGSNGCSTRIGLQQLLAGGAGAGIERRFQQRPAQRQLRRPVGQRAGGRGRRRCRGGARRAEPQFAVQRHRAVAADLQRTADAQLVPLDIVDLGCGDGRPTRPPVRCCRAGRAPACRRARRCGIRRPRAGRSSASTAASDWPALSAVRPSSACRRGSVRLRARSGCRIRRRPNGRRAASARRADSATPARSGSAGRWRRSSVRGARQKSRRAAIPSDWSSSAREPGRAARRCRLRERSPSQSPAGTAITSSSSSASSHSRTLRSRRRPRRGAAGWSAMAVQCLAGRLRWSDLLSRPLRTRRRRSDGSGILRNSSA